VVALGATAQEPSQSGSPARDRRRDFAAFSRMPAADRDRIKRVVGELSEEDPETQVRLLQVMQRYLAWLDRLPAADRRWVEDAASTTDRVERIRELRERQWIASLSLPERERLEAVSRRKDFVHAGQAVLWLSSRSQAGTPGVPLLPLPLLNERQRLIATFRQRERQMELERQIALTQAPERQEAMQRDLQRIRRTLLEKPLLPDERRQVNAFPPDDFLLYVRTVFDLARKYEVPLPEPRRQPMLGKGFPPLAREILVNFIREGFSESVQLQYEERLKDPAKRAQAIAELTALYWNTHPQELREYREQERKKRQAKPEGR
jgi:hypothetical protein